MKEPLKLHDLAYDVKEGEAIHMHPSTFGDLLDNNVGLIDPNCMAQVGGWIGGKAVVLINSNRTAQVSGWIDGKAVVLNAGIPKGEAAILPTKFKGKIDRQAVVDYLNMCLKADPDMMQALCSQCVPVTNLSDANPITREPGLNGEMVTSGLGLINGLIEYLSGEPKPVYVCTEGEIGSEVITHFEV
jgi:hypothetical protein